MLGHVNTNNVVLSLSLLTKFDWTIRLIISSTVTKILLMEIYIYILYILQPFFRLMCAINLGNMTLSDVKKVCVLHTISKAWCLGRAVHRAQLAKTDPVMAVTSSMNGKLVISGKVCL